MCALRAIPIPETPIEKRGSAINPGLSAANMKTGFTAVPILPSPAALTKHLSINQFMTAPGALTESHHHGELDTLVYAVRGTVGFKCGNGLRDYVALQEGDLGFIAPHAVHAENNPDPALWSLAVTVRDTAGIFYNPSEASEDLAEGSRGIVAVPRPSSMATTVPPLSDKLLGAWSTHQVRARRVAIDRIEIAPGETFHAPYGTCGETALNAVAGAVRVRDVGAGSMCEGGEGAWWYLDPDTEWSVENISPSARAELLLIRSAA
jgi:uncharacterized RmlC-like cupin family protein